MRNKLNWDFKLLIIISLRCDLHIRSMRYDLVIGLFPYILQFTYYINVHFVGICIKMNSRLFKFESLSPIKHSENPKFSIPDRLDATILVSNSIKRENIFFCILVLCHV